MNMVQNKWFFEPDCKLRKGQQSTHITTVVEILETAVSAFVTFQSRGAKRNLSYCVRIRFGLFLTTGDLLHSEAIQL